ncbi:hypothetical protein [Hymenobacter sp. BT190]|uniref:hypothetical protein n=1 Tax=Hymenobacter sp. BT190 TaxID=2763505 RepID=UPI001651A663|nr:hypothetical protein [Hymenobacter sp. BT190]MBC6698866.1 hypothetical protein [Hymenobacter sp. BT190]
MIGLKTSRGWLDLLPGTVGIEISNPYFRYDAVPGVTTYPFGLPMTPPNLRQLGFPHVLAAQGELPAPEPVEFYLDGLLWRVGSLVYQEYQPEKRLLQYKFVAGATDLQSRIDGLQLSALDLGQVPLELRADAPDYALGIMRNTAFYGDKNPAYSGYLNPYFGGSYTGVAVAPQLRLVPLLRRVLATVGYTVSGEWLSDASVRQLVAYSNRVAEDGAGVRLPELVLSRHVPAELKVGGLLVELQKLFGLGYDFDLVRRELRIVRLRDVALDDAYLVRDAGQLTRALPTAYEGYSLELSFESEDEQLKGFDNSWAKLVLGAGKLPIKAEAGTLHCLTDGPTGQLMPHIVAKGASPAYELGDDSRCGLRLLFDRGLQGGYPQCTNGRELGSALALQWAGVNGLYAQCHQPWLELLARAGSEERVVPFRVGDLLSLNPGRKELLGPRKYLWEKMSLTASTARRLESARCTYRPVRR